MKLRQAFLDLSITKKLVAINLIFALGALIITFASILLVLSSRMENFALNEIQAQARVISFNIAGALSDGDVPTVNRVLGTLSEMPTIVEATVFDSQQKPLAQYLRSTNSNETEIELPGLLDRGQGEVGLGYVVRDAHLYVVEPILVDGSVAGTLYLKVSLDYLYGMRNQTIVALTLSLAIYLVLSLLVIYRLQKRLSKPILDLSEITQRISSNKVYSYRAQKVSNDELGVLIDGFNEMLEHIEQRDEMLRAHRMHLQDVVDRRTQDLEKSNTELHETIEVLKETSKNLQISEENKRIAEESAKTKSRFLANMSHELRTPMNGVLGMLNLLKESQLQDEQTEYTDIALDSARLLLATLDEILDITKIEAGKLTVEMAPFDLFKLIDEVFGGLGETAFKKGVELVWYRESDVLQQVVGDAHRTKQVLYNLITNAIKFTQHGHILLTVKRQSPGSVKSDSAPLDYLFAVSDTGVGIDPSAQDKIFDSFTQADDATTRRYGGTGLGLTLCKEITQLMGGDITVQSTVGSGSTFTAQMQFNLPLDDERVGGSQAPISNGQNNYGGDNSETGEDQAAESSFTKVLILEDRPVSSTAITAQFGALGIATQVEQTVSGYFTLLDAGVDQKTLLLLDLSIPTHDPNQLISEVHQRVNGTGAAMVAMGAMEVRQTLTSASRKCLQAQWSKPFKYNLVETGVAHLMSMRSEDKHNVNESGPDQRKQEAHKALAPSKAESENQSPIRILVVEDNPVNQKVILARLVRLGYEVDVADNGEIGVNKLLEQKYQLVFMDCQMPVMDGYTATRTIRQDQRISDVPIVALTANALPGDREKCLDAGMDDYMMKPLNPEKLKETLHKWLGD